MQRNIEELTQELLQLSKRDRLEIIRFLLFLDNHSDDKNIDSLWEHEITARVRAVDNGKASGIDFFGAMKKIENHFTP